MYSTIGWVNYLQNYSWKQACSHYVLKHVQNMVLLSLVCCFVFLLGSLVLELYYQDLLEELYVKLFDYKRTTWCDAIEEFENNLLIFQVGYAMTTYNKTTGQPVIGFDMGGMSTLGSTCNLGLCQQNLFSL